MRHVTDEDLAVIERQQLLVEENRRLESEWKYAAATEGVSLVDFRLTHPDFRFPNYGAVMDMNAAVVLARRHQEADRREEAARSAPDDLRTALAHPSFSHLRDIKGALYIYNHAPTSPSGVLLADTVPLTDEVRSILCERRAVVNLGPSRGAIAEASDLKQDRY